MFEPQLRAAAIQLAGNSSMRRKVRRVVAVQQVQFDSADLDLPGANPDGVTGQGYLQPQPFAVCLAQGRDRQLPGVVIGKEGLLPAVLVKHLAEIPLLKEQAHADHRHPQVAGGFELIAGYITESA